VTSHDLFYYELSFVTPQQIVCWEMLPSVLQRSYQVLSSVTKITTIRSIVARYVRTIWQE